MVHTVDPNPNIWNPSFLLMSLAAEPIGQQMCHLQHAVLHNAELLMCLQMRCDEKQGLLAPGMSEVVNIEFCPQQFRYYTDSVRIHSEVRRGLGQ